MQLYTIGKESKYKSFGVLDIESRNWIDFVVIGAYSDDTAEGFVYFDTIEKFLNYIIETDITTWFAHYGGKFDFLFLFSELMSKKNNLSEKIEFGEMVPRGSSIMKVSFYRKSDNKRFDLWDSCSLLPFSLKSLTENFNVKTKKGEIDYKKIEKITPELLEYLKSDCIGLHEVLTKFYNQPLIKEAGQAFTIAGQAMKVFRKTLKRPLSDISKGVAERLRPSYFGGRTEIFKPYYEDKKVKSLFCYDVNSLYPAVMVANEYPEAFSHITNKFKPDSLGFYDLDIEVPDMYCPPLPYRSEDKKLIFPTGKFRGLWSVVEINNALKYGCKIRKVHEGYIFRSCGKIFKEYVTKLYSIREREKKKNLKFPSVDDITAKLLMNSLYGRFGIKDDKDVIRFEEGKTGERFWSKITIDEQEYELCLVHNPMRGFANVAISSYVTSYARVFMYDLYMQCGQDLYYTDTDSLYTTKELKTGEGLGKLKLEEKTHTGIFILPKTYKTDNKLKMKGFDRKLLNFTDYDFTQALQGELYRLKHTQRAKVMTFKSAVKRRGKFLCMTEETEKRVLSTYDKRIFIKHNDLREWDTKPIIVGGKHDIIRREKIETEAIAKLLSGGDLDELGGG